MTPAQHAARCLEAAALLLDALHDAAQDVLQVAANVLDPGEGCQDGHAVSWWRMHLVDGARHLYPLQDGIGHEPAEDCTCGPSTALAPKDDADEPDTYLYRHHPLTQPDLDTED